MALFLSLSTARADNLLTGTVIGTSGSFNNSGTTKELAMDGNINTYFDGPTAAGDWVGLDLTAGLKKMVTSIRYCPRSGQAARMVGGIFQGANLPDFSDATNLLTITSAPAANILTTRIISNTNGFSYVRYLSPTNGWGDVAEVQFYGVDLTNAGAPPAPTNLVVVPANGQVTLLWNAVGGAANYTVKRAATNMVGPYTVVAAGLAVTDWTDSGLNNGSGYYYSVFATNASGQGPDSASIGATPQPQPAVGVYRELWPGLSTTPGNTLTALTNTTYNPNWPAYPNPSYTSFFTNFETEINSGKTYYGQRVRAFVVPPTNGSYTFWIASDDSSNLFLSSDENPTNKTLIAYITAWTGSESWTTYPSQQSAPVNLLGGVRYYLEALMQQGGGGDNLAVRWQLPNGAYEQPLSSQSPAGSWLVPFTGLTTAPGIYLQPVNTSAVENQNAAFSLVATNPAPVTYQWFANGVALTDPNAFRPAYTVSNVSLALNNGQVYRCVVSNTSGSVTSAPVTLTVLPDAVPPTVTSVFNLGATNVLALFSEPVEAASATNVGNYGFTNGVPISTATLGADRQTVTLTTAPLTYGSNYVLMLNRIRDLASTPNTIARNTLAAFTALPYAVQDIGNPSTPSVATFVSSNALNVTAVGADLGGSADQCSFGYQLRTGDFDVRLRVAALGLSDVWAKAGLMARETLGPGSRFAAALATPVMNGCFFEWRDPASSVATSSGNFPANYPYTWLRLKRAGNLFTGYAGYDGQTWSQLGSATITFPSQVYVGLVTSSHNASQATTALFRDQTDVTNATVAVAVNPHENLGPSSRKTPIAISEIMYKPAPRTDTNNLEFIELYNSNPWFHDISGYRLVCADMNYTFPPGTIIPGGGFLVVAASPASIQNVYGLTGVLGPYTGSLKKSESLQLLDEVGAVLLTVPYSNQPPWPVAADGIGHSLVLVNATYGEGDPRAWDSSDVVGGSPGQMDAFRPSPLRNVVINEFMAHTDPPDFDYIELYNHANQPVDISGCILTDDPDTNKFIIPPGTVIPARGFVFFSDTNLNFDLSAAGETLYFKNPDQTRVLDGVRYGAQQNGVAMGRWPDGASQFYRLSAKSPGASNAPIRLSDVVINELMYDPISGNDDDQYIELYNRSTNTLNLTGWQLMDAVSFTFPSNTFLNAGNYLVIARNAAHLRTNYPNLNLTNCLGDYSGKLSHNGDHLALTMPDTIAPTNNQGVVIVTSINITVNDVTYGTGGRWGQWAAGGGSSLELIDPNANTRLAANWVDSDETQKSAWVNIENTGVLDNGQNYDPSIDYAQIGLLDIGECLVDNIEVRAGTTGTNLVLNSDFESGLANWTLEGDHVRSSLESTGYLSARSLHVRCSDRIWTGDNSCEMALATNSLAAGQTATLRFKARWLHGWPEALLRLNGNWLEATGPLPVPVNLGTPGARNSRFVTNAGPAIYEVTHSPAVPAASQPLVVTARVHDPDGVQSFTLYYRVDPSPTYTAVTMRDDGVGGDLIPGDGVFSGTINGQTTNTIVAFYLAAIDTKGAVTRFPALVNDNAPVREGVVMFGDGNPGGSFGVYHLWLTQTNATRWANLSDLSNESHDCTIVAGSRVIYDAQGRFAGSPYHQGFDTPYGSLCHYKWIFPDDDALLGATSFNKLHQPGNGAGDDASLQREQTANMFLRALGVPWLNRRYVAVYVNGNRRGVLMEDAQTPDGDVVKEHFPNDKDGWLYKMQPWFEFGPAPSGGSIAFKNCSWCDLMPFTTTGGLKKVARYRYMFEVRRTPLSANDFTNVFSLVDAASSQGTPNYVASMENLADMENWMRVFAANHAAGNWDAFGCQNGQNLYGYLGAQGTKYSLLMFDFNIVLGNSGSWGPGQNLFTINAQDPNVAAIYAEPTFRRMYWRALQELVNGPLALTATGPVIDAKYNAFVANGLNVENPATFMNWMTQAHDSIAAQIAVENTSSFTVNPSVLVSNNLAYVSGLAPVNVKTVWFNGIAYPLTWTSVSNWTATVPLSPGTNQFAVVGVDIHGQPLAGFSNNIAPVFNGVLPSPAGQIALNEILYNPTLPGSQYVELLNLSSNLTFDLSGFDFHGLGYTFPSGSLISPNNFLVLAANAPAYAAVYGATNPVFDVFTGNLQTDGETLTLVQPGTNTNSEVVITRVRYGSAPPWPANANQPGVALQLIDPRQDNWRVGNWAAVLSNSPPVPQWTYFTATGTASSSLLYIYLQSAGDVYLDDLKFVRGSVPEAGANLLADGDFESGFPGPWTISANLANSALSTVIKHSGNSGLHVVSSSAGSTQGSSIWQVMSPPLLTNQTYTLSFWFLQSTNGGPLTIRLSGSGTVATLNPAPPAGVFSPTTPGASNSVATPLAAFPSLWLNELQADNLSGITNRAGQRTAWLELYNPSTNALPLNGLYLANNYTNLTQWAFPTNAVINPGQFKVIFADGQTNLSILSELHTSFLLPSGAGSLALTRLSTNAQLQVLDYVDYTNLTPNYSYGSLPDGQSFARQSFFHATPGGTNDGAGLPPPSFIRYTNAGWVYTQNFDTLPNPGAASVNTGNPVTINGITYSLANPFDFAAPFLDSGNVGGLGLPALAGWYGLADPTASVGTRFGATDGDQTTGGVLSFGLPNNSNRAVGLLATSSTGYTGFGAKFVNQTPYTLSFINLQVTGEVWRQSDLPKTLEFYYLVDPTAGAPFSTNYTAFIPALNVSFPTVPGDVGGAAVDGTAPANQVSLSVTNQLIANWTPGAALWLVWEMADPAGKSQGLGIDNLAFSATVWPAGMTLPPLSVQAAGTNLVFSWPTYPGLTYQLQFKTNLNSTSWTPIGSPLPGTGLPLTFTSNPALPQGYYRLSILP
jgi:hypothetical protein